MTNKSKERLENIFLGLLVTVLAAALFALWVTVVFLEDVSAGEILSLAVGKVVFVLTLYILLRQWLITQAVVDTVLRAFERVLAAPSRKIAARRWDRELRRNIADAAAAYQTGLSQT